MANSCKHSDSSAEQSVSGSVSSKDILWRSKKLKGILESTLPDKLKMNQMQNLLHEALIDTRHVENGAIIRRKDVSLRASSAGFSLSNDQMERFVAAFRDPPRTREEGLFFNERKYKCVRADTSSIYAKCDKIGVVLVKTGSLIVVGTYNDNMYPSVCIEAVEKLASYFKEKDK
ncbi:profilin-4-like isoform X1 [Apostichopus japonicus]|uniref:profilin-4-like isoform X1 n=1 Tax=Stichopus japonicus TaxID=307972 RepID=UPI003AB6D247